MTDGVGATSSASAPGTGGSSNILLTPDRESRRSFWGRVVVLAGVVSIGVGQIGYAVGLDAFYVHARSVHAGRYLELANLLEGLFALVGIVLLFVGWIVLTARGRLDRRVLPAMLLGGVGVALFCADAVVAVLAYWDDYVGIVVTTPWQTYVELQIAAGVGVVLFGISWFWVRGLRGGPHTPPTSWKVWE